MVEGVDGCFVCVVCVFVELVVVFDCLFVFELGCELFDLSVFVCYFDECGFVVLVGIVVEVVY